MPPCPAPAQQELIEWGAHLPREGGPSTGSRMTLHPQQQPCDSNLGQFHFLSGALHSERSLKLRGEIGAGDKSGERGCLISGRTWASIPRAAPGSGNSSHCPPARLPTVFPSPRDPCSFGLTGTAFRTLQLSQNLQK